MEFNSVIIFGSSGFLGKNLSQELQKEYFVNSVFLRQADWKSTIPKSDVFINLIGKAHDHDGVAKENDFYFANVELTKKIFEVFKTSNAKLLIHISSLAAIEELASVKPLIEEDECNPNSWYGKSKRMAEKWLLEQQLPVDKKVIIIRPPMIHGSGDKGNLSLLYKLVSRGFPYPLASFENRRSFISIDNFNFFIKAIIKNAEKINTGIFHIADDETISTKEIINIIKNTSNKKITNLVLPKSLIRSIAKIGDFIPIPLNTVRLKKLTSDLTVSNQKIKSVLNIRKLPLTAEEGIMKTIYSFKIQK
ncbi:NAD-dependent epimerase/dehydratase family protein [Flavobacterium aquicola]|uniref:Nucleoside-diphosphate-sugar epimerase n=1 Tax=Flavobacterium aquicola TaxID=1682742 RepID=A0A3E0EKG6_9FLAO|nr:NAD-dependent epimerase/dehydratase family protein [Flavobacterium aquicola]REG98250.1 nucleoside-diphosphate-sugar epimerase [Flavobacterium aquicola]